jgi:outer membrane lipoprotein-sorting protein
VHRPREAALAHERLWVDAETLVTLKTVQSSSDGRMVTTSQAASVDYDLALPRELFTFMPLPGASITDTRAKQP